MPVNPTTPFRFKALPLILACIFSCFCVCPAEAPQARTRERFAALMSQISPEMTRDEVEAILGKPDDIRTKYDPGGIRSVETGEIWRYGTNGHLTTATLGSVYIDDNGEVQGVCGGGDPPPAWMFPEEELRTILRTLDETPSYNNGWGYNPRGVIRAVNALQPLGKEKALAAVAEYLRIAPYWLEGPGVNGMFLVLRTLFEIPNPPGHMPVMLVGQPSPMGPEDLTKIPRFPIYIQDDIPFLMVSGYSLFGQAEDPKKHLNYFREHGIIRSLPMVPSPDPVASIRRALDALSNNGTGPDGAPDYDMLFNQALWLLDSVYKVEEVEDVRFIDKMFGATISDREKATEDISRLKLRWDVKKQDYTFVEGTTPQFDRPGPYRRNIWKPDLPELNLTMTIERISRKAVELSVRWTGGEQELSDRPGVISIYNASDRSLPVTQIKLEYLENGSTSTGATIMCEEGQMLFAVFEGERTIAQSPEYKP
jgi:hypothetical protein